MESTQFVVALSTAALAVGYGMFHLILRMLPYLEKRENLIQRDEVLREAQRQQQAILADAQSQAKEKEALYAEELEASIQQLEEDLAAEDAALTSRAAYLDNEDKRVERFEQVLQEREAELAKIAADIASREEQLASRRVELITDLEKTARINAPSLRDSLRNQLVEHRQLESQKVLKGLNEELSSSARKRAQRLLDRVHARYAPDFVWPKATNVVEVTSERSLAVLAAEQCQFLDDLREMSGVTIQLLGVGEEQKGPTIVKVAGGYGIYREAAKATLDELIPLGPQAWGKAHTAYQKHCAKLEAEAVLLGRKAVNELRLGGIHPEIQKLVGSLNWRTSYRQNQWYHTVEVAVLAGILARELGVNSDDAKRVGLLHDIGKAIDYRIEGSHAVISGDYADRFGETRYICDTVMSHHADLLVETPLAYVLRAADTLSGARPGARVNLEEGYQIRLEAIADAVKSFPGIADIAIMNGGREVHVQVNHKRVKEHEVKSLAEAIARKIEEDVAYPGQIKVMVTRSYESVTVA